MPCDVIVSTDDSMIAECSLEYGAEVPFMRPSQLAASKSTSEDVVAHCVKALSETGRYYQNIILLQPTSPLRTSAHIDEAFDLFVDGGFGSLVSVAPYRGNQCFGVVKNRDNPEVIRFLDYSHEIPAERKEQCFSLNGAIYIVNTLHFIQKKTLFATGKCAAYQMDPEDSVDIDYDADFFQAETRMRTLLKG